MTFTEIEKLVRREIDDEVGADADKYVQKWQVLAYANDAEQEACIRGRLLTDSTSAEVCSVALTAGTATYAFDPRILHLLRGKVAGAARPVSRVSFTRLDELVESWEDHTGEVVAFVTGMDKRMLRLYRNPVADGVLNLSVVRLPLADMTADTGPEIPTYLHTALVPWIKYRIYNNQDSELFNKARATEMLAQFELKFGRRPADQGDIFDAMQIPQYELGFDLCATDYL